MTDLEIAQQAKLQPLLKLAESRLNMDPQHLEPYGHYKAKVSLDYLNSLKNQKEGHLILVTAISPTPAGEGKTTTTVGLGDALNLIGKDAMICLREPSLGPCFGVKGGAAGGGHAQIVPMEDINLHFTGDFHAIGAAHNLLAAMIDNHIHHGNDLMIDSRTIPWRRVVDMNDRALRNIVVGLGGTANGFSREDGYDIVVASEVMAILCLSKSLEDLKERLGRIIVGYTKSDKKPIFAADLKAHGAMAALLKDAIKPNLVQTLENNLAFVHGGPFANIAHGCNTLMATQSALKMADYVVTEAGFGADLGAEKFIDIKCRKGGLKPSVAVLVATIRALKFQGGVVKADLGKENIAALEKGLENIKRHLFNITQHYNLPCVVAINHFTQDTEAEVQILQEACQSFGVRAIVAKHWAHGSVGAQELAHEVVRLAEQSSHFHFVYEDSLSLWDKIKTVAQKIYGATDIRANSKIKKQLEAWTQDYGHFPVCIAKNQYSFSTDPTLLGAPQGHIVDINGVRIAHGAGFVVALAGDIMTMPGLPKVPAAEFVDVTADGRIKGLF